MTPLWSGRWVGWLACALSAIVLVLATVMTMLGVQNRLLQDKVAAGHAELQKEQTFATLDNSLVRLLAKTAAEKNDVALKSLLMRSGVTFSVEPDAAAAKTDTKPAAE